MTEKMINELMKNHEDTVKNSKLADVVVIKKPGKEPELIRGEQIDREIVNLGLFLELCDLGDTGLIAVYDSRKAFDISGKKYVFGTVIVVHKGKNGTEAAAIVGKAIAERALEKGISTVAFDRGGYLYHGRVKSLAEAAREAGLKF